MSRHFGLYDDNNKIMCDYMYIKKRALSFGYACFDLILDKFFNFRGMKLKRH